MSQVHPSLPRLGAPAALANAGTALPSGWWLMPFGLLSVGLWLALIMAVFRLIA